MPTLARWIPTFLAFPLGGLLAVESIGGLDGPAAGAAGGLLAGAVIGAGQWLALRSHGIGPRWAVFTAVAMAAGTALATVLTGAGTTLADLMLTGLVAGAAVGAAQGPLLARGARAALAWVALTAGSWPLGWLVTWVVVGVNVDQGFTIFGSSGALVVTLITGLALRRLLGRQSEPAPAARAATA